MLGMIVVFIASYATGLGNVPWHTSELFPLELRGMGSSALTASCWAANILISATFLTLMNSKTGAAGAFGICESSVCVVALATSFLHHSRLTDASSWLTDAGICFLGMIFIYFCFPEVRSPSCAAQRRSGTAELTSGLSQVSNLSLEEIQQLFSEDFGIQKSRVIRRQHRAARHAARDARKLGSAEELA